jgi:hypothetical protein
MEKLKQEEAKRTALTKAKIEAAKARVEAQLQGKPVVEVKTEPAEPEINLDVRSAIHLELEINLDVRPAVHLKPEINFDVRPAMHLEPATKLDVRPAVHLETESSLM